MQNLPHSATETRSFLGLTNFCSRFIKNYATLTAPLRELTKKHAKFRWETKHQIAFDGLKEALSSDTVLGCYNPNLPNEVIVDASPVGLCAILVRKQSTKPNAAGKVIASGSRAPSPVERR